MPRLAGGAQSPNAGKDATGLQCLRRNCPSSSGTQIVLLDIKGGIRNVSQSLVLLLLHVQCTRSADYAVKDLAILCVKALLRSPRPYQRKA